MAGTRPLIFDSIEISDAGGGNPEEYDKHLVERATVTPEPATTMIDDGQTITDYYDLTFEVGLYNADVLDDTRVYSDASTEPVRTDITFKRASGAVSLKIESVIINGNKDFSGNRVQSVLTGSKRGVSIDSVITEEVA